MGYILSLFFKKTLSAYKVVYSIVILSVTIPYLVLDVVLASTPVPDWLHVALAVFPPYALQRVMVVLGIAKLERTPIGFSNMFDSDIGTIFVIGLVEMVVFTFLFV
eukprot:TRINITY_DN3762_c0_g1_i1.p3 TRINITY_DN3762_c0_g1~~TRINITY_DN3762_c0_g1_i1.p3  ORF type:complete len:106 (+),score=44.29 TRINITY_DN3762_c0_g1_i1:557-874(+)